jgi:hypothetical protein
MAPVGDLVDRCRGCDRVLNLQSPAKISAYITCDRNPPDPALRQRLPVFRLGLSSSYGQFIPTIVEPRFSGGRADGVRSHTNWPNGIAGKGRNSLREN